jgi:propane monooxygenase coupling protein
MTEFAENRTSSNMAGVTLMNNQVGYVVDYEEIAEALGWDDFGNDDFEEIMSTHYGRMVVLDDRVLLFANPEDAAEYIGFDLQPVE